MLNSQSAKENRNKFTLLKNILLTLFSAVIGAIGMHVFVYPIDLAPMGIDGVATMLQYATNINAGYFSILLNLPLLIIAWFFIKKSFVLYTLLFTVVNSATLVILKAINFYQLPTNENLDSLVFIICAGVFLGIRTGVMLKIGASSGGIDIIAAMFQRKMPHVKIENVITVICSVIIIASCFVYGSLSAGILALILNFVFEYVVNRILRGSRQAVEVKIITKNPDEIIEIITHGFEHGGYQVEGKGIFSGEEKTIIYSVINIRQIPSLSKLCKQFPGSFIYYSSVDGVYGNFRWRREDEVK